MQASTIKANIDGLVIHWSVTGQHNRDRLVRELSLLGLSQFTPAEKTDRSALKHALKNICCPTSDYLVQCRQDPDTNGVEVVKVDRAVHGNGYCPTVAAKVVADGLVLVLEPGSFDRHTLAESLQAEFNTAKGEVCGTSIGKSLVAIARHYGAVCTRESGGVYYLPPAAKDKFTAVAAAVEASAEADAKSRIDMFEFVFSQSSLRCVRDSLIQEVLSETEAMKEDFAKHPNPKPEFVQKRMEAADLLRQKLEQYEQILNEPLEHLKEAIDGVTTVQGVSILQTLAVAG